MKKLSSIAGIFVLATGIFCIAGGNTWVGSLLVSVAIPLIFLMITAGLFFILRGYRLAAVCTLGAIGLVMAGMITNYPSGGKQEIAGGIRMAHFNVLRFNTRYEELIDSSLSLNADIISFQEIDSAWAENLIPALAPFYPYCRVLPENSNCHGIAVFSRFPLQNETVEYYEKDHPNFHADVVLPDGKHFHYWCTHTQSPLSGKNFQRRNRHLEEIAETMKKIDGPCFLVGDLNTVPWDSAMIRLCNQAGLDGSNGSYAGTYPSSGFAFLTIPIDYILYTPDVECRGFEIVRGPGSDHSGIMGEFILKNI